ncbi:sucrase ferredoxin [Nodosilinea sp. E11]|uniref:sucrase ferredoxin n=1 Tax=Nodosilinea sp. E11 TaxID=3037479 RepID=UPI00293475AA|nr:sucrase ferredoxin [Nodosilinea sp. E11]WOD40161.1 sucrase ferredoxin [Nodosilinea sp. E11]
MVSSCAVFAQQQGESLIGTAPLTRRFVLIECPHPWAEVMDQSCGLPADLAAQMKRWAKQWPGTRFLLFTGQPVPPSAQVRCQQPRRLLFFEAPERNLQTYQAMQMEGVSPDRLTAAIADYFTARSQGTWPQMARPLLGRHLFICTHGRRDRCCGRYGYPLYRQTSALVNEFHQLQRLPNHGIHLWQVSHIGGHRFAPTLIDFPEGRYYGALTLGDCRSLLLRQGSLALLSRIYRGWALLPEPVQILERLLWQQQGWSWLEQPVDYTLAVAGATVDSLSNASDLSPWQVSFTWGETCHWQALIQLDPDLSCTVFGSCGDETPLTTHKYQVTHLQKQVHRSAALPVSLVKSFANLKTHAK